MANDLEVRDPYVNPDVPTPVDQHATHNMLWVMRLWVICFLLVVGFGLVSYLTGWWFRRGG